MITELKIGDKVKLEGYDEAWIGWVYKFFISNL